MDNNNKIKNKSRFNKIILIIICIVLSVALSYGLKTYIDYQRDTIDEEEPHGACATGCGNCNGSVCSSCASGYFATNASSSGVQCTKCQAGPGEYCVGSATNISACPAGTFQPSSGKTSCLTCVGNVVDNRKECTQCSPGYYKKDNSGSCGQCPAGSYCDGGKTIYKCPSDKPNSPMGSSSQSDCKMASSNDTCEIISIDSDKDIVTRGDSYHVYVKVSGYGCSFKTINHSVTNGTPTPSAKSGVNSNETYIFTVTAGNVCSKSTATASVGNSSKSVTVTVTGPWKVENGNWLKSSYSGFSHSAQAADANGKFEYYSDEGECSFDASQKCYKTHGYRDGCATTPPSSQPSVDPPVDDSPADNPPSPISEACYKNQDTGIYKWGEFSNNTKYTLVSSVTNKADCITPIAVQDCEYIDTIQPSMNEKLTCDGTYRFIGSNSKSCSVNRTPYYEIMCDEGLNINLIPDNTKEIKLGLGISYNIDISTERVCRGNFNNAEFKETYEYINRMLNIVPAGSEEYYNYSNNMSELMKMINDYNSWSSNYNLNDITASFFDNQTKESINFIKSDKKPVVTYSTGTTYRLNISGVSNPSNFTYTETLSTTLTLPSAYYSFGNQNVVYNYCNNCVLLGNKYYLSSDKRYGNKDYKYTISVNNLGYNKNWNIKTTDCQVKALSDDAIYRPVDVKDPFLNEANSKRETGKNWLNGTFDFTNIINSDTWKEKALYEFNITPDNVKAIKKNNHELGANVYIGSDCELISSRNKYYCKFLRDNQYFQYHYIYSDL